MIAAAPRRKPSGLSPGWGLSAYLLASIVLGLLLLRWQLGQGRAEAESVEPRQFVTPLWTIAIGILCNVSCAVLGCYLVLRRMSLLGDAISHAVLPGIAIGFLLTGSLNGWPILLGAMVLGVLTSVLTQAIAGAGRVAEDSSMGIVFTSLFALGVILITSLAARAHIDPECILYGQIEYSAIDLPPPGGWQVPRLAWRLGAMLAATLLFVVVLWKELKIVAFDPALAAAMGFSVPVVHYCLMSMVACVSVSAFEPVGSILVVAMLIVPAATASLLTDRLGWMLAWSATIAAASAIFGYIAAAWLASSVAGMMAVAAGVQLAGAVCLAPRHGLVSRWLRNFALAVRITGEDIIGRLFREEEAAGARSQESRVREQEMRNKGQETEPPPLPLSPSPSLPSSVPPLVAWLATWQLRRRGWLTPFGGLTDAGRDAARSLIRAHRLWESYLDTYFDLPRDHLHDAAERMEHFLDPELQADLDAELAGRAVDPHGKQIPPATSAGASSPVPTDSGKH
ncbi:MAG: metal ABC transporter permease [Pirellulaceae bacterium]|nr:metal ABC transporter permease [Pirellulaceae bacterium]